MLSLLHFRPMPQSVTTPASSTRSLRVQLAEHALATGLPFDRALQLYAKHALLLRLQKKVTDAPKMTLTGGNALAVHLGAEHRRLDSIELFVTADEGLDRFTRLLRHVAKDVDGDLGVDYLDFDPESLRARELDRGHAKARQLRFQACLRTAETAIRLDVEEAKPEAERMDVTAPFELVEPVTMAVASPTTVYADSVERIVRRDALRVPMRSVKDAWLCIQVDSLENLAKAIEETFSRRGTPIPKNEPYTLSNDFAAAAHAQQQWEMFVEREAPGTPVGVEDAVAAVREASMPAFEALR